MEFINKAGEKTISLFYKINGDWDEQSKSLKAQYPILTSEDLKYKADEETDLYKRLEAKLDKDRNEVINILKANQEACCKTTVIN